MIPKNGGNLVKKHLYWWLVSMHSYLIPQILLTRSFYCLMFELLHNLKISVLGNNSDSSFNIAENLYKWKITFNNMRF